LFKLPLAVDDTIPFFLQPCSDSNAPALHPPAIIARISPAYQKSPVLSIKTPFFVCVSRLRGRAAAALLDMHDMAVEIIEPDPNI